VASPGPREGSAGLASTSTGATTVAMVVVSGGQVMPDLHRPSPDLHGSRMSSAVG